MNNVAVAVGVDIGGSKTHAVASCDGQVVFDFTTGSANLQSVDPDVVRTRLGEIFGKLGAYQIGAVCVGAAGADSERQIGALRTMVQEHVPHARVTVVHDAELLLAAAGQKTGIALLSGTGSVAWGRGTDGRTARAGGWGYLLGDEGSGFWVFREAVRRVFEAAELGREPGAVTRALFAACDCNSVAELLDHVYEHRERRYWAQHAQLVLALAGQGDPGAALIRDEAATALVDLARRVRDRLGGSLGSVVLAGGLLTNGGALPDLVREELLETGFTEVRVLDKPPAYGALVLADREL